MSEQVAALLYTQYHACPSSTACAAALLVLWRTDNMLHPRQWHVHQIDGMFGWCSDLRNRYPSHAFGLSRAMRRGRLGPVKHTGGVFDSKHVRWRGGEHIKTESIDRVVCCGVRILVKRRQARVVDETCIFLFVL